ncbi:FAD-dependent oxidoreductase [Kyrpidia sp.]|uniref:NAD(P)/FAD-dependent oxidoreductase n=1 Tax=Kyrpidia sp. TaxID=2073077 RepID=UPI002587A22F|nr:FAD-dependent oxidoreductase [Kyrpidia sp.]MCL6575453.1 FAD-binding oxidoreductase [Kyrpidia sp.]
MDEAGRSEFGRSFWLDTCGDDCTPRSALAGEILADVVIVGAGFTGLWTAHYLVSARPDWSIAMLEREIAGYGASGRNGGWCTPELPISPGEVLQRFGREAARRWQAALYDSVGEIETVLEAEGIDAHFHRGGSMMVALGAHGLPLLEEEWNAYRKLGVESHYEWWDGPQARERVNIRKLCGALYCRDTAVLHPGRLVRGLARRLERRGVRIYERTPVLDIRAGDGRNPPEAVTKEGLARARVALVVATEGYTTMLKPWHRNVTPVYSSIVVTEPLPEWVWKEIGWANREAVASTRLSIDYLQKTVDGRILFGGRGEPYHLGSRIRPEYDRNPKVFAKLMAMAREWFPALRDARFTHGWSGPLGMTRDQIPNVWYDRQSRLAGAWGYVGAGVVGANLAARILSTLIWGEEPVWEGVPIVQHRSVRWEPEPFRWLGIRYVQHGLERLDRRAERTGKAPRGTSLPERWFRH